MAMTTPADLHFVSAIPTAPNKLLHHSLHGFGIDRLQGKHEADLEVLLALASFWFVRFRQS